MCFSPTASFAAAAVTAAAGSVAVHRCTTWRQIPFAIMPIIFAAQQAIEGGIWLGLQHAVSNPAQQALTTAFMSLALALWPILTPSAAALIEEDQALRRIQILLAMVGVGVAIYAGLDLLRHPYTAGIVGSSICYVNQRAFPIPAAGAYLLVINLPLLISSNAAVRRFGLIITTGMIVSFAFYFVAFVSVWCFFAALASVALCSVIRRAPRTARGKEALRAGLSWRSHR